MTLTQVLQHYDKAHVVVVVPKLIPSLACR